MNGRLRLNHLRQNLLGLFFENGWLKLLSLVLATLLFYFSKQPAASIRISGVPVEFVGVPAGMEIVHLDSPVVNLQLRGPRNLLAGLSGNEITVPVNLSNREQGERVAHLQLADIKLPERVEVMSASPASLRLRLERTVNQWVKVRPLTEGQPPEGFELYDVTVNPEIVQIEGPEREVSRVEFLSTETINLTRRNSSFSRQVDLEVPTPLRIVKASDVSLTFKIGEHRVKRVVQGVVLQPPDSEGTVPAARLTKIAVELWGPESLVNELKAPDIVAISEGGKTSSNGATPLINRIKLPDRYRDVVTARQVSLARPRRR